MFQKFFSVLHQANALDEVTGQHQVTSNVVTSHSGCSYKATKNIIVGQRCKLIFSFKSEVAKKDSKSIAKLK